LLDQGIDAQDLADLIADASILIREGKQSPKWWYPGNLFGEKTMERWIADIGEHLAVANEEQEMKDYMAGAEYFLGKGSQSA